MRARGRAGLVTAVGAVAVFVVDAGGVKGDGGIEDAGEDVGGLVVLGDCRWVMLVVF